MKQARPNERAASLAAIQRVEARIDRLWKLAAPGRVLFWVLALLVPPLVIVSTHVWLRTAYSSGAFDLHGFVESYSRGVFRFRVAGREIVLFIYRHLRLHFREHAITMPRGPQGSSLIYASYVILDGLAFTVSNYVLLRILFDNKKQLSDPKLTVYFFLTLIQALAMAVLTPYDQLAYALLLISLFVATIRTAPLAYIALVVVAVAGALTRETQFLVTPALATTAIYTSGKRSRQLWAAALCNLSAFGITYAALRLLLPGDQAIIEGLTRGGDWAAAGAATLATLLFASISLLTRVRPGVGPTIVLLFLSTPYILPVAMSGALRELRLLVPVLMVQTFVYASIDPGTSDPSISPKEGDGH